MLLIIDCKYRLIQKDEPESAHRSPSMTDLVKEETEELLTEISNGAVPQKEEPIKPVVAYSFTLTFNFLASTIIQNC